jgi:hypothetical protein
MLLLRIRPGQWSVVFVTKLPIQPAEKCEDLTDQYSRGRRELPLGEVLTRRRPNVATLFDHQLPIFSLGFCFLELFRKSPATGLGLFLSTEEERV